MKIAVFTPTRLPGFDVTVSSIERQILRDDMELIVIVADELIEQRDVRDYFTKKFDVTVFRKPMLEGNRRNLAASYNEAIRIARSKEAYCMISLQDYIWIENDGIKRLVESSESLFPAASNHLIAGICDISATPFLTDDFVLTDSKSIFPDANMASDKPREIMWSDSRRIFSENESIRIGIPIEWETNWAMIGNNALYDERLYFDEEFDKSIAHENQDYSYSANRLGYDIYVADNVAVSLPHKVYWPLYEQEEAHLTIENRNRIMEKYGE